MMTKHAKRSALSHDAQLIRLSRDVTKLERHQRALRASLKATLKELRFKRRELRKYAQAIADNDFQTPPMRLFGEV